MSQVASVSASVEEIDCVDEFVALGGNKRSFRLFWRHLGVGMESLMEQILGKR